MSHHPFLAALLAAAALTTSTACIPPDDPLNRAPATRAQTVPTPSDGIAGQCDDHGHAHHVHPDTPAARRYMARACRRLDDAIDRASWPRGWHG